MIELKYTAEELEAILNPLIARELASIQALDAAMPHEHEAAYVYVYRSAKAGKQANVEQMTTMLRLAGGTIVTSATLAGQFLRMQARTSEMIGTTTTLRAMRIAQTELKHRYEEAFAQLSGVAQKAIEVCWHRAIVQWVILTAHIAKRGLLDIEENLNLPMPLESYFANGDARACMRCHFDRPGQNGAIERGDPHPYTYICSACHDETLAAFPPDLAEQAKRWSRHDRESRVVEKALGRPSKVKAENLVLHKYSDIAPDLSPPPEMKNPATIALEDRPPFQPRTVEVTIAAAKSLDERLYNELLFDFESVRENW